MFDFINEEAIKHMSTFKRYLLPHEERALFSTVRRYSDLYAKRDCAWMRLMRQTGIRVGTLVGLKVRHAQEALRTGYLTYENAIAKRGQGGSVFVTRKARQALQDLLLVRRQMGYHPDPDAPLVMSRKHRGLSIRSCQWRMRRWVELAGLPVDASPHWLRHTLAKRIVERSTAREPLLVVQSVLGHKNISNTAIYARPDREQVDQSIEEAS